MNLKIKFEILILKFDFDNQMPNVTVAEEVDVKKFKKIYFKTLKRMP